MQKKNEMGNPSVVNHYNSMSGSTNKREVESSGYADRLSISKTSGHQFSNSIEKGKIGDIKDKNTLVEDVEEERPDKMSKNTKWALVKRFANLSRNLATL